MAKELRVVPKYTYSTGYRNANLFGGDFLEAGKLAFIEATAAIGIHSGLKKLPLDFPVVLDIETTKGLKAPQITAFCLAFLTHIKARTDKTPILYTGASFAKTHLGKELAGFPLWVADYGTNQPMGNPIWSRWAVFQHSDCGKVAGIKGNVDMNWMEKDFWNANMKGKQLWIKC
nr:glycoside hydrolase family 25 protein [Brevibacillus laterosporus]